MRSGGWERSARDARSVPIVDSGESIPGPAGGELPVFVSPLVDARYGPTAALGIPAVDEADARARRPDGAGARRSRRRQRPSPSPRAREAKRYRANDFSISRQRSWGTPIPVVHCEPAGRCRSRRRTCRLCSRATSPRPARATRWPSAPTSSTSPAPAAARRPSARPTPSTATSTRSGSGCRPRCRPRIAASRCSPTPTCGEWLPAERLVAGGDSGGFVFDQRIVTKALRDIGPFYFLEEGEPFAGCLFHEMVIAEGRKMSKHLGNVVNPDELVEQYGADTVRLAVLYAAGPAKTLNWSDGALRFANRFLRNLWTYSQDRFAALEGTPHDEAAAADTAHMRDRLRKWCENGLARIGEDVEQLQMHKAVRNITRLFERIQDFEKRVVKRRGQLDRADAEAQIDALVLLARVLAPFAPHTAEELLLACGCEEGELAPVSWPESAASPRSAASPAPS